MWRDLTFLPLEQRQLSIFVNNQGAHIHLHNALNVEDVVFEPPTCRIIELQASLLHWSITGAHHRVCYIVNPKCVCLHPSFA